MQHSRKTESRSLHNGLGSMVLALGVLALSGRYASAQTAGWNAVYGPSNVAASYAVVDATQYSGDICTMINSAITAYNSAMSTPTHGIVVDARGVSTPAACSNGATDYPWYNLVTTSPNQFFANIVLLPAGTITIGATWILPNNTQLVGEGPNTTTIQAASTFSQTDMIEMGHESASNPCAISVGGSTVWDCSGIVIEHLAVKGNGTGANPVNGINNCCAQELSRVNDVSISNVPRGLWLSDSFSENSGPYTNLMISGVNTCLRIGPATTSGNTMVNSRGVHGLTCSATYSSTYTAAITIDGPNNSLEDISISGSNSSAQDGILIGSQAPAEGNTLINIQGSGLKNVIHVSNQTNSNPNNNSGNCPYLTSGTVFNVCDLTILGVANSTANTTTVQDDLTISNTTTTTIKDSTLAMYTLGESVASGSNTPSYVGYSRYTTATAAGDTNAPSWLVGVDAPSGSCAVGTLYSCTGTSSQCAVSGKTAAVWQCMGGSTWHGIQ